MVVMMLIRSGRDGKQASDLRHDSSRLFGFGSRRTLRYSISWCKGRPVEEVRSGVAAAVRIKNLPALVGMLSRY